MPMPSSPPLTETEPQPGHAHTDRPPGRTEFELLHSATDLGRTGCARYYAFWHRGVALGFEREPRGESLLLGSELHKISENYLTRGEQPDRLTHAGQMFIAGLPHLPPPGSGGVEAEKILSVSGYQYFTAIDYQGPLPRLEGVWSLDHKTSKNPAGRYTLCQEYTTDAGTHKEKKGFLDDVQAVIIAAAQLLETGASHAQLRWLYYKSVGTPIAIPRDIRLARSQVEDAFGTLVHPLAERATALRGDNSHPLTLEPNPKRCHAYGRPCHYTEICNLSLSDRLNPKPKVLPVMSLLAKAEARGALAANSNTTSNGAAEKPATATGGLLAKSAAKAAAVAAPAPKEDKVNPPEAKQAPAQTIVPPSMPALSVTGFDGRVLAVVCDRIGDALKLIAADLRK